MPKLLCAISAVLIMGFQAAQAEDRVTLGWGRLFQNDAIGDGHDRWHTMAYSVSRIRGTSWRGDLPATPGEILEFRMRTEILTPQDLTDPAPDDRSYAGAVSLGMHTQFAWQGLETAIGADLVITGPQTRLGDMQAWVHGAFGLPEPATLDSQIPNGLHPTLVAEIGRVFDISDVLSLRPFLEAQAGIESFLRAGGDLVIGRFGRDDLMLRDKTSGQRYRGVEGDRVSAVSLTLGADVATVFDSRVLPAAAPAVLSDARTRVRAGVHWQGEGASAFYGLTYLGQEFDQQPAGQLVGALNLNLRF